MCRSPAGGIAETFCQVDPHVFVSGTSPIPDRRPTTGDHGKTRSRPGTSLGDSPMKFSTMTAALVLFASVSVANAGLFDCCRHRRSCEPEPVCCAPTCCAPTCAAPECCAPPTCEAPVCCPPACCAPAPDCCCAPAPECCDSGCGHHCGGLRGWFKKCCAKCHRRKCCEPEPCCAPACCAPVCAAPTCCAPTCAAPSCAAPACCN